MGPQKHVTVIGACFMDYIAYVDRFPQGGETLHASSFQKGFGGKGANQAVMIGRLGGRVRMVGRVGSDGDGSDYIKHFKEQGIETQCVDQVPNQSTGLAKILVDRSGENTIVICPNATSCVTVDFLKSTPWLENTDIVVCQNEVPFETNLWAIKTACLAGKTTVYIPAPAPTPEQVEQLRHTMQYVTIFAPNQHEAGLVLGYPVNGVQEGMKAAVDLRNKVLRPDAQVLITLGAQGCIVLDTGSELPVHIPASKVPRERVVDTTGAGDCFTGALCYFLSLNDTLYSAVQKANYCAGMSVQKKGTQSSYPLRGDLPVSLSVVTPGSRL